MKTSVMQRGSIRRVRMSLDVTDLYQLLDGSSVYYEQRRAFSKLEIYVDLDEVRPQDLLKLKTGKETGMSKWIDKQEENCLKKAQERGDVCFTLVEQDLSSPVVICEWIKQNIETAPIEKLQTALNRAFYMAHSDKARKHAD